MKAKKSAPHTPKTNPGPVPILKEVLAAADALRQDAARVIGTIAGRDPKSSKSDDLHRLKSITGRIPFTTRTMKHYAESLSVLRGYVESLE